MCGGSVRSAAGEGEGQARHRTRRPHPNVTVVPSKEPPTQPFAGEKRGDSYLGGIEFPVVVEIKLVKLEREVGRLRLGHSDLGGVEAVLLLAPLGEREDAWKQRGAGVSPAAVGRAGLGL